MYKLVSLDLDGTFLNSKGELSKRNYEAVKRCHEKGIETVIATGRPPRFTFNRLPDEMIRDYIVCYNGARIYKNNQLVKEYCLPEEILRHILSFCSLFRLGIESNDAIYVNYDVTNTWPGINGYPMEDFVGYQNTCKVLIVNEENFPIEDLLKRFGHQVNIFVTENSRLIEIVHKGVSKCAALAYICEAEGLSLDQVIAFGDDANDLDIIECSGYGVAMANGIDILKEASDFITLSNDEDGVAEVLDKITEYTHA